VASGQASLYHESGEPREDFALADLFGAHWTGRPPRIGDDVRRARESQHTYLRLAPELRANVYGPKLGTEPPPTGKRHPVLQGFEETDLLPFGGRIEGIKAARGTEVLMTFVPSFPVMPPETAWMRTPRTELPGLIVHATPRGSRVAYLAADLDRRYDRDHLPDHANLLANLVRWAAGDTIPLAVEGPGLVDCHLYRQPGRMILHLVNLTNAGTWRAPIDELIPVGPFRVRVRLSPDLKTTDAKFLVSPGKPAVAAEEGWATLEVPSILDHEVIVLSERGF
jgi:hypothetical protein